MWDWNGCREVERQKRVLRLRLLTLAVLAALLLALGGCSLSQRLQSFKGSKAQGVPEDLGNLDSLTKPPEPAPELTKVVLYFRDQEGRSLVPEKQEVPKVTGIGKAALEALCKGPVGKDLKPSLPQGAGVREVNVKKDGTCVVDLNKAATKIADQDPRTEALAVAAIVNTLTEFSTVKRVQILVEGQIRKTLAGHIPIDTPLTRNLAFVKE